MIGDIMVEEVGGAAGLVLQKDTYSGRAPLAATRRVVLMAAMGMGMGMAGAAAADPGEAPGNYASVHRVLYGVTCHTQ